MRDCWRARNIFFNWVGRRMGCLALSVFCLSSTAFGADKLEFQGNIIVDPEVWALPSNPTPLRIGIEAKDPIPPQVMLVVRNVPVSIRLSEGRPFGPGVWVLPLNALNRVNVLTPAETGDAEFRVALVTLDGATLAEAKVVLHISANGRPNNPAPARPPAAKRLSEADREAATKLLEKGHGSIKRGNVSIAREFYKRAANMGLSDAALALGATYDSDELARMQNVFGIQPDKALAKKWYERARELGSEEATTRLRRLE